MRAWRLTIPLLGVLTLAGWPRVAAAMASAAAACQSRSLRSSGSSEAG